MGGSGRGCVSKRSRSLGPVGRGHCLELVLVRLVEECLGRLRSAGSRGTAISGQHYRDTSKWDQDPCKERDAAMDTRLVREPAVCRKRQLLECTLLDPSFRTTNLALSQVLVQEKG